MDLGVRHFFHGKCSMRFSVLSSYGEGPPKKVAGFFCGKWDSFSPFPRFFEDGPVELIEQ